MNPIKSRLIALLLLAIPASSFALPETYEFDSITSVMLHRSAPTVSGVLRNQATVTSVGFADNTNISFRYTLNRCVPVFLTMMEKPGKYYMVLVVDPADTNIGLISCTLQLR